jgi:hypothetical protein
MTEKINCQQISSLSTPPHFHPILSTFAINKEEITIGISIKETDGTADPHPGSVDNLFPPGSINDPAAIQLLLAHGNFPWQFIPRDYGDHHVVSRDLGQRCYKQCTFR